VSDKEHQTINVKQFRSDEKSCSQVPSIARTNPRRIIRVALWAAGIVLAGIVVLELFLRWQGLGDPPLYEADPYAGYALKPTQQLTRLGGSRVHVNSLGMRSTETTRDKMPGKFRVLVVGDSVPYGGSYIDQEELFCRVAEKQLDGSDTPVEILNAGVNAYGPRNILGYVQSRGLYEADMVIVYLPWGTLLRDFTSFYIVPFWSNSPLWALAELCRFGAWKAFGALSQRWKGGSAFSRGSDLDPNLKALARLKGYCEQRNAGLFYFFSPCRDVLTGEKPDQLEWLKVKTRSALPAENVVDMTEVLHKHDNIPALYVDDCHYSRRGHLVMGAYLAQFIRAHLGRSRKLHL
jgi:hypothetical protein